MFSSLKSLITTPLSWSANATNDSFGTDAPLAYRVKCIRLDSPDSTELGDAYLIHVTLGQGIASIS